MLGILAAIVVPFNHMTVKLFRGLHPQPVVLKPEKPSMSAEMGMTFGLSMVVFTILFIALLRLRMRYAALRDEVEAREGAAA